jgi:hypothetical protein
MPWLKAKPYVDKLGQRQKYTDESEEHGYFGDFI